MKFKFISVFLTVLLTAVLLTACGEDKLRYNVNSVSLEAASFEEYYLTDSEINELFDALSLLDFSEDKTEAKKPFLAGTPVIRCTVETDVETISFAFLETDGSCIIVGRGEAEVCYNFRDDSVYLEKVRDVIRETIVDKAGIDVSIENIYGEE